MRKATQDKYPIARCANPSCGCTILYSNDPRKKRDVTVRIAEPGFTGLIEHYIDRAYSAKTDNRPEFQRMIRESARKAYDVVIVWKLDRFSRNRFDSAKYKAALKKNNVRVVSATEAISEGAEGIILESVLEGMAEYYSADLSERKALNDDKLIDDIVHMFMEFQQKENTVIPHFERELVETEKAINNMLNAIEQGIITPMTKKRLDALEEKHRNIETDIVKEKMKHPLLTEEQVRFWFERMREYDITVLEQRKRLIDTFVNAIFVYNDRLLFTFNYKRYAKTVLYSDLKSSDISKGVRPVRRFITNLRIFFILRAFSGFLVSAPPRKRPLFFCSKSAQNRVRPHV